MSSIKLKIDGIVYPIESFTFSGGEQHLSLNDIPLNRDQGMRGKKHLNVEVLARLQGAKALVDLLLITEVLNRLACDNCKTLVVPYFPYARQDRVIVPTEPFSLQGIATLLNIPIYHEIVTYDLHSRVAFEYMKRLKEITQLEIIKKHKKLTDYIAALHPVLVAPDKGALAKSQAIALEFGLPLIHADKRRDATGKITNHHVHSGQIVDHQHVLICDDLCDGGATFLGLARQLINYGARDISLYVTHGIFSKGYAPFAGHIKNIFTTNTFIPTQITALDDVTVHIENIIKD